MGLDIAIWQAKKTYFEPGPMYGLWGRRTLPKHCGIDGRGAQDDSSTSCRDSGAATDTCVRCSISKFVPIVGMPRMIQFVLDFEILYIFEKSWFLVIFCVFDDFLIAFWGGFRSGM